MNLQQLSPTEIMIYREAYADGLADGKKTPVREFHEVFGHPISEKPTIPPLETRILRVKLLLEEVLEFAEASGVCMWVGDTNGANLLHEDYTTYEERDNDCVSLPLAADALADIRYVCDGANIVWGFPQEELLQEVHRSNMSKLGEDRKPIYREDGKIMKGPNFTLPDIEGILKQHGWEE